MKIRELEKNDLPCLLALYMHLHNNKLPEIDGAMEQLWGKIIEDANHHIVGGFLNETLVSSCVIVIIPNLTHNQRPYALVENVVTHTSYRNRGYATSVLNFARDVAQEAHCYKIMLLTGSKDDRTFTFYEKAGYNRHDKTAFLQWL